MTSGGAVGSGGVVMLLGLWPVPAPDEATVEMLAAEFDRAWRTYKKVGQANGTFSVRSAHVVRADCGLQALRRAGWAPPAPPVPYQNPPELAKWEPVIYPGSRGQWPDRCLPEWEDMRDRFVLCIRLAHERFVAGTKWGSVACPGRSGKRRWTMMEAHRAAAEAMAVLIAGEGWEPPGQPCGGEASGPSSSSS